MSKEFLSQLVHYRTYAKYLPEEKRRENKKETINRYQQMMIDRFPKLTDDIVWACGFIKDEMAVPAMRMLQFAGQPVLRRNNRAFNCTACAITSFKDLADLFYFEMSGSGVGFSVQKRHIKHLPKISEGFVVQPFVIQDSAEAWCDSLLQLLNNPDQQFDYTLIRLAGTTLSTGGLASGPKALISCHANIRHLLRKAVGRQLTSFEVHRICCFIANCVVVGGVRRSSQLCLFDYDDQEMLNCKKTGWFEKYPELARANNSAILQKNDPDFNEKAGLIIQACFDNMQGEPGLYLTNDIENFLTNPCGEIALRNHQGCNLSEINVAKCFSSQNLFNAARAATIFGTCQATFTDFSYVQEAWKKQCDSEALIGVSLTGQAENLSLLTNENLQAAAKIVIETNKEFAKKIGINPAARTTTCKPSGTASSWLGTTSGVHCGHELIYLRRVRIDKITPLAKALKRFYNGFVVEDPETSTNIIMQVPIKMNEGTLLRSQEGAVQCLERVGNLYKNWILPGHVSGANTHNISLTISYHEHEKEAIKKWMIENKDSYFGISLIPYDGGDYKFLPYLAIHPEVYDILSKSFTELGKDFNFDNIKESKDGTSQKAEPACSGGSCLLEI